MKEYFLQIPYDYNLSLSWGYFYVLLNKQKKNNVLEKFINKNLSEIYQTIIQIFEVIKRFCEIINYNQYLSWGNLRALTPLFQS